MIVRSQIKMDKAGGRDGAGAGSGGTGAGGGAGGGNTDLLTGADGGGGTPQGGQGTGGGTGAGNASAGGQGTGGGQGDGQASDWRQALPQELRENQQIGRYKSLADLANGYINLQRHFSGEKLVIPGKSATEDDWKQVFTKLGVPEKVEDYKIKFKEGVTIDENFSKEFASLAHKSGILPKQAQALADWFSEKNAGAESEYTKEMEKVRTEELTNLKKDWGAAYDKKLGVANSIFRSLPPEVQKTMVEAGLSKSVALTRALSALGEKYLSEDQIKGGAESGIRAKMSPAEAKKAADGIMGNAEHPYHKKEHPGHAAAVKEVQDLFEQMYPKT